MKAAILLLSITALAAGQRPSFAGFRPIGYPEITTEAVLDDRFGTVDGTTTTQRLPIEANGDRDLVDRLSKLPIDKQPFWFINWQAIEANQNRPQTFPQKPNQFVDDLSNSNIRPQTYPQKPNGFVDDLSNQGASQNQNPSNNNNNPNFGNNSPNFGNNNPNFGNNNPNFGNNNPNFANNNPNFPNNNNNPSFANNNPNFANNNPNFPNNNNNPNFPNNNNSPNSNGVNNGGIVNRFGEETNTNTKPSNNNMAGSFGAHNIQVDKAPPTTQVPKSSTYKVQYYYQ